MPRARSRPNGKFLTLKQAELETGLSYDRLWQWVVDGTLPRLDVQNTSIYIRRADLDKLLESRMTGRAR
jgi:hypothetical protein